jgi:hypothetical protein
MAAKNQGEPPEIIICCKHFYTQGEPRFAGLGAIESKNIFTYWFPVTGGLIDGNI